MKPDQALQLEQRIALLEEGAKSCTTTWWGRSVVLFLLVSVFAFTTASSGDGEEKKTGKQSFNIIQAQQIQITRSTGEIVAVLGENERGNAYLTMFNSEGNRVVYIGTTVTGNGYFNAYDSEGKINLVAGARGPFGGYVSLRNSSGNRIAYMGSSDQGDGVFNAHNSNGDMTWINEEPFSSSSTIKGDLDNDGDVDFADFVTLAKNYGKKG